ncbi:MAG: hypothetical protein ABWZ57_02575 [Mesorhizobium sp.]
MTLDEILVWLDRDAPIERRGRPRAAWDHAIKIDQAVAAKVFGEALSWGAARRTVAAERGYHVDHVRRLQRQALAWALDGILERGIEARYEADLEEPAWMEAAK